MPLSTIVLGGYLGAGKTTLLNHLLRHAQGRRIAVMVNDFGAVGIDADLIESSDGEVMSLAGGCICCSVGSDLVAALMGLAQRVPPPDLVLIETSGVALPGSVARGARLAPGIEIDAVVVLVDAETIRLRANDRHVGDTVVQQLAEADLLVLNKIDLVDAPALATTRHWLAGIAPHARIIESVEARVPAELILGLVDETEAPPRRSSRSARSSRSSRSSFTSLTSLTSAAHPPPGDAESAFTESAVDQGNGERRLQPTRAVAAGDRFETFSFQIAGRLDAQALAEALCDPAQGVLRAKGLVHRLDGQAVLIQTVGARSRVSPVAGDLIGAGLPARLVVIGLRDTLDAGQIAASLACALSPN
jgi:G3E family GTPase